MIEFLNALWAILAQSGFWLLVGFLLAGLLKQCVPQKKIFQHLGKENFASVLKASVIGAPLPLCSLHLRALLQIYSTLLILVRVMHTPQELLK